MVVPDAGRVLHADTQQGGRGLTHSVRFFSGMVTYAVGARGFRFYYTGILFLAEPRVHPRSRPLGGTSLRCRWGE
jgi:hypothetical protein